MTASETPIWTPTFALAELKRGSARVFSRGHSRIAVFHLDDGSVLAIDDRCPHEGYPLAKGFVNGCVVTCRWHAFRYDLRSGQCLVGDEHARVYPLRIAEGVIELDLTPPDRDAERARYRASLAHGLERRRSGQVARDIVRLLDAGATPRDLAFEVLRWDALRAPNGMTHGPAVVHDILELLPRLVARHGPEGEVAALLIPLDLIALSTLGYGGRPIPAAEVRDSPPAFDDLRRRVEAEDGPGSEALIRGAVAQGVPLETLWSWFRALVSDHLLDFGHQQIYLPKVFALLREASPADRELILGNVARSIALATREELLPEWSWVVRALETPPAPAPEVSLTAFVEALSDGTRNDVLTILEGLIATVPADAIIDALVVAASVHLLRYDLHIERDPTIQEGWLDVTHALTTASALRDLVVDSDAVATRRLLYFGSAFVQTRAGADAPPDLRIQIPPADEVARPGDDDDLDLLQAALERRDADGLVTLAAPLAVHAPDDLTVLLEDWCLLSGAARPIFAAHQWKTLLVGVRESQRLAAGDTLRHARHLPLLAAARFIAGPHSERDPMRLAHEAIRFVRDARVPRRVT